MAISRIYLPANNKYIPTVSSQRDTGCVSMDDELKRYVEREFPSLSDEDGCVVYPVPRLVIRRPELRASKAEENVFQQLKDLKIHGLWLVFFQGRSYGGKSFRNDRSGKLMIREHDYVILTVYQGVRKVVLVEVKSTCDAVVEGVKQSDAKMVKNSKRTALHQLRDHVEMLGYELDLGDNASSSLNCFVFWPFLSRETRDPQGKPITRWRDEHNHAFSESFQSQLAFTEWFHENVLLKGKDLNEEKWNLLFERFIILSCGVFVDEIHKGMLALLSQEQLDLLNRQQAEVAKPLIIHGAAGTGKTLLVMRKLKQLHEHGQLHAGARALYICYWPGIRCEVQQKLVVLGIDSFVDTTRYFISMQGFLKKVNKRYKHIFMDESEAICLSLEERIITETFQEIFRLHQLGNSDGMGSLWFLVDINQASLFLPKFSPPILKTPDIVLTKVIRSTCTIYKVFNQFYHDPIPLLPPSLKSNAYPTIHKVSIGHTIEGPPIYWVNCSNEYIDALVSVIVDLCATKGVKPNDLCILPFLINDKYSPLSINEEIKKHFVEHGFMPQGLANVESFLLTSKPNNFLVPWVLRVKGLEFKVVVMVIEDEDFDFTDAEDRRKLYIMASRCTCLLVLISPRMVKDRIDTMNIIKEYPFSLVLE